MNPQRNPGGRQQPTNPQRNPGGSQQPTSGLYDVNALR